VGGEAGSGLGLGASKHRGVHDSCPGSEGAALHQLSGTGSPVRTGSERMSRSCQATTPPLAGGQARVRTGAARLAR
jgi:hypothetical protein